MKNQPYINLFHSPDDEALARLEALYRKRATSDWRTAESVPADRSPLTLYAILPEHARPSGRRANFQPKPNFQN